MHYSRQIHLTGKVSLAKDGGTRSKPSKKMRDETIDICLSCTKKVCRGCREMKRHIVKKRGNQDDNL